jgi:hypothetical protein
MTRLRAPVYFLPTRFPPRASRTPASPGARAAAEPAAPACTAVSTTAFRLRPCFVNVKSSAAQFTAVQIGYGALRLGGIAHLYERKPSRAAGVAVRHDPDAIHGAVRFKQRANGLFRSAELEVAYKYLLHLYPLGFES